MVSTSGRLETVPLKQISQYVAIGFQIELVLQRRIPRRTKTRCEED